jgi:hypothetical protein
MEQTNRARSERTHASPLRHEEGPAVGVDVNGVSESISLFRKKKKGVHLPNEEAASAGEHVVHLCGVRAAACMGMPHA